MSNTSGEHHSDRKAHNLRASWNNPDAFLRYEIGRQGFRKTAGSVIHDVLSTHAPLNGTIIEVGAGMGELVTRMLPEVSPYRRIIQQTEQSKTVIRASGQPMQHVNISELSSHFKPNSITTIVGLSMLDTVDNLNQAMREVKTVLSPGGKIIHFLDLMASPNPIFASAERQNMIPFPQLDESGNTTRVILVKRSLLADAIAQDREHKIFSRGQLGILRKYQNDPINAFASLDDIVLKVLARKIQALLANARRSNQERDILQTSYNDYFFRGMKQALDHAGLLIEKFGVQEATSILPRQEIAIKIPNTANAITNDVGLPKYTMSDRRIAKDHIQVTSRVHVIVAKK